MSAFSRVVLTLISFTLVAPRLVLADGSCLYVDNTGFIRQVPRLQDVPSSYRQKAKCSGDDDKPLASPKDVELTGRTRTSSFGTDLGRMEVRWQRAIEECFGKSPSRAVSEAARATNRAIKNARFADEIKHGKQDWEIVFTDKATALSEFPAGVVVGGHPGFMVPPSQIYIIASFIPGSCSGSPVADAVLTQVLLHEMGHVIEYLLVSDLKLGRDSARSEGFASWFEQYAAQYASDIPEGQVTRYYDGLAREALASDKPASFDGSAQAYAVAALTFRAIVDRKGVSGLMRVYRTMSEKQIPFHQAVQETLRWNNATMDREMRDVLASSDK